VWPPRAFPCDWECHVYNGGGLLSSERSVDAFSRGCGVRSACLHRAQRMTAQGDALVAPPSWRRLAQRKPQGKFAGEFALRLARRKTPARCRRYRSCSADRSYRATHVQRAVHSRQWRHHAKHWCRAQRAVPLRRQRRECLARGDAYIEERSFDCVPRRAKTARKEKSARTSLRMTAYGNGAETARDPRGGGLLEHERDEAARAKHGSFAQSIYPRVIGCHRPDA
jgi:hypothetical protein